MEVGNDLVDDPIAHAFEAQSLEVDCQSPARSFGMAYFMKP
jgi:hypothetical protein